MTFKVASHDKSIVEIVIVPSTILANAVNNDRQLIIVNKHFVSVMLANFHAGYFRISLSLSAQVLLWTTLIQFTKEKTSDDSHLRAILHILPSTSCILLWSFSLVILLSLSLAYALRCYYHFGKVKAEFLHHVGVNYLFAPSMSYLFLLQSSPTFIITRGSILDQVLWWMFVTPILMLDVKIYGQWLTKGKRFLSRVANPTSQLSVIANFVGANTAFYMGWKEVALCLFSLALVHYLVLFVTLYQRLPITNGISTMLRPVFFLFVATPSMASLAWSSVAGSFDSASKMLFFVSLFLFMSLICRPTLFKKSMRSFKVTWWAYSFPLTLLALASMEYARVVEGSFSQALTLVLSILSIIVSFSLMILTTMKMNTLYLCSELT